MKLIDCFYQDGVIDCYTFVLDERDPWTNYSTMLATDHDGRMFSQWTDGFYEPGEANPHLGVRPQLIGEALVNHVVERMSDDTARDNQLAQQEGRCVTSSKVIV